MLVSVQRVEGHQAMAWVGWHAFINQVTNHVRMPQAVRRDTGGTVLHTVVKVGALPLALGIVLVHNHGLCSSYTYMTWRGDASRGHEKRR